MEKIQKNVCDWCVNECVENSVLWCKMVYCLMKYEAL